MCQSSDDSLAPRAMNAGSSQCLENVVYFVPLWTSVPGFNTKFNRKSTRSTRFCGETNRDFWRGGERIVLQEGFLVELGESSLGKFSLEMI